MPDETIGNWTINQLVRFIDQKIRDSDAANSAVKILDELQVARKLTVRDELMFGQSQTTVGAAGAASALPATPDIYVKVLGPDGVVRLLPLYKS